jgi:hypothetical protein
MGWYRRGPIVRSQSLGHAGAGDFSSRDLPEQTIALHA